MQNPGIQRDQQPGTRQQLPELRQAQISGVPGMATWAPASMRAFTSGRASQALVAAFSFSTTGRGVPGRVQLHQFTGRPWDRFSRELARYGLGVLRAWIRYGTIYGKAKALTGYGLGRIEGWPNDEVVEDIAADTVVAALIYFRDKVLMTHRWQSSGGASLGTFFVGQCLYQFANIYRSALRAELERIEHATTPIDDVPEDRFDIIKGIEATIVANDTVAEAMALLSTDRARRALFMQEHGFSQREIADELGLPDAKSVENLIGYQLRQLRKRTS